MNDLLQDLNPDAAAALARFHVDLHIVSAVASRHSDSGERFVLERLRRDALRSATQAFTKRGEPGDCAWAGLAVVVRNLLHHRDRFLLSDDDIERVRLQRFVYENADAIESACERMAS
jgi:hypothetical protein